MASFNKVLLMGNLTRNPELRYTNAGGAVCQFGMAINRRFTVNGQEKSETCYVDVIAWGRQGETVSQYMTKGSPIFVEGRLQFDQWDDKETGAKRSKLQVIAEVIQFIGSRGDREGAEGGTYGEDSFTNARPSMNNAPAGNNNYRSEAPAARRSAPPPPPPGNSFDPESDNSIPF